jgi:PAS domain S-box-containing protein/putative nucleotidyltransferase with HDIG domain
MTVVNEDHTSRPYEADSEAVMLTDAAGAVVAANAGACVLLRRAEREICALGWPGLTAASDAPDALASERRRAAGQYSDETTLVRGDGTTFLARSFLGATISDHGRSGLTPIILRDLTAQKADQSELDEYRDRFEDLLKERAAEMREAAARVRQEADDRRNAEAELKASEERFRVLVERSSDLMLIIDGEARVTYCSPSAERLTGYCQDEITGMIAYDLIHEEDPTRDAALRMGPSEGHDGRKTGTVRIRTKDGSMRWFDWSSSTPSGDGVVQGTVVTARDVTERVLTELAIRSTEERYRILAEASPDMIYVVGADGRVHYVNGHAALRLGVPAEKLVGASLGEMFTGTSGARITSAVQAVLASGEPYEADSRIAYPGGERWISTRLVALSEDGRVTSVLGVSHDITERILARDALVESEQRYRSLFEDSPVAMWEEDHSAVKAFLEELVAGGVDDVAGYLREHAADYQHCVALTRTLDVNRTAVTLFEASSREDLLGRKSELYPPDSVGGRSAFWAAMLDGALTANYEENNLTLAGRELRVLETCTVAPGCEETCDRVYVADIDVGERRRAEELLRRYRLLFAEARDIMLFVRAVDGRIVEANAAAEAAYGYPRKELLRLDIAGLRADKRAVVAEQVREAAKGGVLFETVHLRKDGSAFPVEVSSRGIATLDGETLLLSVIRDITYRKQTEAELARTTARLLATLDAAVAALGAMAELRDPYTAGHQRRVAGLSCAIATELGWGAERIAALHTGALLHDLGKIVVPAEILAKPGKLSEAEFTLIRQHAASGAEILADIDFEGDVAAMALQHHERLDGSGYPAGLKDGEILPEARILAVADVVEAMVSHRPYRPALSLESALSEIEQGSGSRYDAEVGAACCRLLREGRFAFEP